MFILVLVFGGALMSIIHVSRMVATAKNRVRAVAILNQKMEEMRALTFTTLTDTYMDSGNEKDAFHTGEIPMESDGGLLGTDLFSDSKSKCFTWSRADITDTTSTTSDSLRKILVTVTWDDMKVSSSVNAFSYFSKYGVMAR